ncbi:MAG: exonuclease [Lysobacteraceae bacterium]|nr:MAG: exonuclease [Xanthomonadaceae bacterium]
MSVSLEKLRALKREAGGAVRRIPPDAAGTDAALAEAIRGTPARPAAHSIDALRKILGLREKVVTPLRPRKSVDRDVPGEEISPGLRLIESHLPMPAPDFDLSLAFARRHGESVDPRHLLFFDTETTGLAGGTGTRAFMIGAADWHHDRLHGDGLRVRQLLMTTLAAEGAMLEAFGSWLQEKPTVLSSYNGRCYDSPLLKTRYRLARKHDPITPLDHVDLLFPTRRRYRGTWENCRLATIERELLRIVREDDLPGSEAPAAWLDYLRGGSARNLRRVAAHNHQDVVTLALLMLRLVEVEAAGEEVVGFVESP